MSNTKRSPHPLKLTQATEYWAALAFACRLSGKHFLLRAGEKTASDSSGTFTSMTGARLGLIASRKAARRSVDRNRGKRLVREAFRAARMNLPAVDVVVQLKNDLRDTGNRDLRRELDRLLRDAAARFGAGRVTAPALRPGNSGSNVLNNANQANQKIKADD